MGCCAALALFAAMLRRRWPGRRQGTPSTGWHAVGTVLFVGGLCWFVVGLVGMHLLGWFSWASHSLVGDVAFHSSGLWVAAAGAAIVTLPAQTRRCSSGQVVVAPRDALADHASR